jgi:hypothetical protein
VCAAITRRTLETSEPFLTAQIMDETAVGGWLALIRTMGFAVRDDAGVEMNGRRYVPCVADFADLGTIFLGVARRAWGLDVEGATSHATEADLRRSPVPPGVDIEAEVVRALGHHRDLVWLGSAPLGVWLFPDEERGARALHLQKWLVDAIASTETMRNGAQVARALHASFDASRSLALARRGRHCGKNGGLDAQAVPQVRRRPRRRARATARRSATVLACVSAVTYGSRRRRGAGCRAGRRPLGGWAPDAAQPAV